MTIRKTWRLLCLTVASLFWASCSNDSSTQPESQEPETPSPDSSAADEGSSSSSAPAKEQSSSSVAEDLSSSSKGYVLASDLSVTCEPNTYMVEASCGSTESLSCDDYKKYLASDTTLSQKLLTAWEEKLQSCGAIQEPVTLYGISYNPCPGYYSGTEMKCSNGSTYRNYYLHENRIYRSVEEYNEALGISSESNVSSSSSVAESSSSAAEDAVKNCPQEGFALFADILADVQKELYVRVAAKIDEDTELSDAQKEYLENLLDRDNQTLKGAFAPYEMGNISDVMSSVVWNSENWFNGYIAKTKTCAGGTPVTTKRYQEMYDAILAESLALIENTVKAIKN